MRRRAGAVFGALVVAGYLAVAVVTAHVSGHSVLPLYEGVPAPAYQWVNPPAAFKTGNVAPTQNSTTIAVDAKGNREGGISSQDTQFIVTLSPGAIPPKPPSKSAAVKIEPLDPATFAPLPGGARADGNAYRMSVTYDSDNGPLAQYASNGSIVLSVPLPANRGIYYSPDGRAWTRIAPPAPATQPNTVGGSSPKMGIFVAATTHRITGASSGSSGTSLVTVIVGVLVGIVLVGGAAWFLLRLLRPVSARPSGGGRRPPRRR